MVSGFGSGGGRAHADVRYPLTEKSRSRRKTPRSFGGQVATCDQVCGQCRRPSWQLVKQLRPLPRPCAAVKPGPICRALAWCVLSACAGAADAPPADVSQPVPELEIQGAQDAGQPFETSKIDGMSDTLNEDLAESDEDAPNLIRNKAGTSTARVRPRRSRPRPQQPASIQRAKSSSFRRRSRQHGTRSGRYDDCRMPASSCLTGTQPTTAWVVHLRPVQTDFGSSRQTARL